MISPYKYSWYLWKENQQKIFQWLDIPPTLCSIVIYEVTKQLQFPISYLLEEFDIAKARMLVTLKL